MDETNDGVPTPWTKVDIIRRLADVNGYRNYLEICTPTTGLTYANVDRARFEICHRMMYRCADDFADGMDIDFRSADLDIAECIGQIRQQALHYDVILVDPWHEYETSFRDLQEAFALIPDHGAIVVHDCLPPTEESANPHGIPDPVAGGWAGLTYRAYLDFVMGRNDLAYCTIDTDWGCGVIRKSHGETTPGSNGRSLIPESVQAQRDQQDVLVEDWKNLGSDFRLAYRFLREHRQALLHLITLDEFLLCDGRDKPARP